MFDPAALIAALQTVPPDLMIGLEFVLYTGAVLLALRLFGEGGLVAWIVLASLSANLQVLKASEFVTLGGVVPLGTTLIASIWLATDLLNERFGDAAARRAIWIGFAASIAWVAIGLVTLGFRPDPGHAAQQAALETVLLPVPAFVLAGMVAYLTSNLLDITLFRRLRRAVGGRHLWLRVGGSTAISSLIDTVVFTLLAFVVLRAQDVPWETLLVSYILGTWVQRLAFAALQTPTAYLARLVPAAPAPA